MNILILAAGYATRLYPLTLNKAKPLLEVAGKPMLEWVLDNLAPIPDIATVYIVTNNKFAADFQAWADGYGHRQPKVKFHIVNDRSMSDQDKLGAIGDINLVVSQEDLTGRPARGGRRQSVQRVPGGFRGVRQRAPQRRWRPMTWATWKRSRNTTT